MHFCPGKKCMDPVLKLDNNHIHFVKEAKFLGLIWDTELTFEPRIKYLKARCQKSRNILKVLSGTEWGADRTTLLKLYHSFVRSKLDYGCIVYGSASKPALAKLDPVHNQGLSLGAFRSSPVESLYVEAHEPPLEIRREKLALQYTIKLKANPWNPAFDVVFNTKYLYANKDSATDSFGIYCKKLLKEAKIDVGEIAINSIPDVPIWDSEPVTVDFTFSEFDKSWDNLAIWHHPRPQRQTACFCFRISQGPAKPSQNWDNTLWWILPRGRCSNWQCPGCDMFWTDD